MKMKLHVRLKRLYNPAVFQAPDNSSPGFTLERIVIFDVSTGVCLWSIKENRLKNLGVTREYELFTLRSAHIVLVPLNKVSSTSAAWEHLNITSGCVEILRDNVVASYLGEVLEVSREGSLDPWIMNPQVITCFRCCVFFIVGHVVYIRWDGYGIKNLYHWLQLVRTTI